MDLNGPYEIYADETGVHLIDGDGQRVPRSERRETPEERAERLDENIYGGSWERGYIARTTIPPGFFQ